MKLLLPEADSYFKVLYLVEQETLTYFILDINFFHLTLFLDKNFCCYLPDFTFYTGFNLYLT